MYSLQLQVTLLLAVTAYKAQRNSVELFAAWQGAKLWPSIFDSHPDPLVVWSARNAKLRTNKACREVFLRPEDRGDAVPERLDSSNPEEEAHDSILGIAGKSAMLSQF